MRYLDLETAVAVIERRGWGPVRDVGLLDSTLARPAASAFGDDAFELVLDVAKGLADLDEIETRLRVVKG